MIRKVTIDGQVYPIDAKKVLGSGGEATVIKVNGWAVKIYHQPDPKNPEEITNLAKRIAKVRDFVKSGIDLPPNVCVPLKLAKDIRGHVAGFAMKTMGRGNEVVQMLSSKKFRRANPQFGSKFITDLFIHDFKTTELLHTAGVIIGDNNDLNKMFDLRQPVSTFIDVDSFQFGSHPCMVATEAYLDPALYNIDLATKCYFKPENDWYSFWAMFIKSLIMVHPYGGVHGKYRNIPQRALNRITCLDIGVNYPKAGLHPDLLNDDLKGILERIFKNGERFKPPIDILTEYRDQLIECPSCKTYHPGDTQRCPQCATINTQQIQRKVQVVASPGKMTVNSDTLLTTTGNFVWMKLYGSSVFAIAKEGAAYILHVRHYNKGTRNLPLFSSIGTNPRFDMFGGRYLVANKDQFGELINIYDTQFALTEIARKTVEDFHGRRMFACSEDHLLRIQNGYLYRGYWNGTVDQYVEQQVAAVAENQTWLVASPLDTTIFGVQRVFNEFMFFIQKFTKGGVEKHAVPIPTLDTHESILSASVRFAATSMMFLMKTEIKGKTYARVFIIHLSDGRIISQYRVESLSSDTHSSIHGKAFAKPPGTSGLILHPTDDGIVQEIVDKNRIGRQTLLSETEQFIADSDSLYQYQKGILVVGDNTINYLTMS